MEVAFFVNGDDSFLNPREMDAVPRVGEYAVAAPENGESQPYIVRRVEWHFTDGKETPDSHSRSHLPDLTWVDVHLESV